MKTRSKYILLLFVGMIVLLLGGIFFTAQQEKEGPITAEAASVYWGSQSIPTTCPSCGEANADLRLGSYSSSASCEITLNHYVNNPGGGGGSFVRCRTTIILHSPVSVPKREPTCTTNGNWAYTYCGKCHAYATSVTTIPALGHDYGEWFVAQPASCTQGGTEQRACQRSGCSVRETRAIEATGHTWDSGTVTVSATCQRTGTRKYECTACGETKTETIAKRSHNYNIYLSRIEPTCTASGRTAGYECQWCYANTCSTIPALGHDLEYYDGQPATCTEAGWNNYETCSRCEYTTYREIAATGHTPGAAATCTTPQTCTECGAILVEALGHKTVSHLGQDATCTEAGWKPYETCENCDYTTYETIPALGHSFTNYISDNNATCTEDGTETAKCDRCEVTDTRTDEGSALGHDWAEEWTTDGTSHWHKCSRCDEINDKANHSGGTATCIALAKCEICGVKYGDFAEHVYVENAEGQYLVSAATCTAKATYYKSCSVCGEAGEEVFEYGEPLGHEYGEPEWTWEGYTSATATFTCTRGCGDKQTITASGSSITNVVTTPAECETEGLRTYTAKVMFGGEEYVTTTTETLEVLGHDWAEKWTTDGASHWHKCSRCDEINDKAKHSGGTATCIALAKCEICGVEYGDFAEHVYVENADEQYLVSAATCTVKATYYKSCSVCGEAGEEIFEYGEPLGHEYGGPEWTWEGYTSATATFTCTREDCGDKQTATASGSSITSIVTTPAECEAEGLRTYTAKVMFGGEEYVTTTTETLEALGHDLEHHEAKPATCTEIGWNAYDTCTRCDYTTYVEIEALGHDWAEEWTTDGTSHWHECSRCDEINDKATHGGGEATCTNPAECEVCGAAYGDALGHTEGESVRENEVPASCTVAGSYDEVVYCSVCGDELSREEKVIDALGHDLEHHEAKPATCTEIGWEAYDTCTRCDYTTYVEIEALGHDWAEEWTTDGTAHWHECSRCDEINDKANHSGGTATCIALAKCEICGAEYGDLAEHVYVENAEEQYLVSAATCTAKATYYKSCSVCGEAGEEIFEYGEPLGHEYGEPEWTWEGYTSATATFTCTRGCGDKQTATASGSSITSVVTTPAECEKEGLRTYTAKVMFGGEEYVTTTTETIEALGHDLKHHEAKPATCTEIGWNAYDTCTRCDYTTYVEIEALGHTEGEAVRENEVPASCTAAGSYDEVVYCSVCGEELSREEKVIDALGHSFTSYVSDNNATCTVDGTETAKCDRCEVTDTRTDEGSALGHDWAEEWTTDGTAHWHECSRCDEINDKASHSGGEATCTNPAECEVCGAEYGSALGHDLEHHEAKPATCTEIGWEAYDTCTRCDYTTYVEIPAKGHTFGPDATCTEDQVCLECGEVISAATGHIPGPDATCTENQTCSVCGEILTPALGHSFTSYISDNNATCTEDGTETAKCDRCEVTDTRTDEGSALGHDLEHHEAKPATCTEIGWNAYDTCTRCDYTTYVEIEALGHNWAEEWTTDGTAHWHECSRCDEINDKANHSGGEATCTNPAECEVCGVEYGSALGHTESEAVRENEVPASCTVAGSYDEVVYCSVCGEELSREEKVIDALGHSFTSYISDNNATCTEDGTETAKCDRCEVTDTRTDEGSALGHNWAEEWTTDGTAHWHKCSRCDEINDKANHSGGTATCIALAKCEICGAKYGDLAEHVYVENAEEQYLVSAATCTAKATYYKSCSVCGEAGKEIFEYGEPLGHEYGEPEWTWEGYTSATATFTCTRGCGNKQTATASGSSITNVVTTPAECETEGLRTYTAKVMFGGEEYVTTTTETIEALGHDLEHHEAQPATCIEIGWNAYDTCTRCDYTTYVEIEALGHTEGEAVRENEVPASCTAAGSYDEVVYCSVCGEELSREEKVIDALGHDLEHHEAKPATCTEIGWNAYDTCTRCDYTTYVEIEALGHTEGEAVRENEVPASCTAAGSYDEVVYCSVCGEELSREEKVVEALGHDLVKHEGQAATCTQNGWNDYETCTRCDYTTYREIAATGHTPGAAATCTSAQRCTVCGTTLVPARGHHFVDGYCSVCGAIDGTALDNDKDDAKTDLDDIAQDAKDEIDGSDLPDDVKEDLKDKVDEIINGAKDEVEGSTDFDDVDQAVENAKDEIEDAILDAEKDDAKSDLDEIAQGAKDEVDGSDLPDDVKDDLKDKIDEIVNDAKTEIDGEASKEEVDQTVEDAQQEIEDAILNAEKDDAKSDLDEIAQSAKDEIDASDLPDDVKDELKGKVDAAVEEAKEAIDNATSKEEIENIVNDTREDIDDLLKGSLDNELAEKKDAAISDLTEIAQDAKDGIDGSDISDEEKDELKGKVDEIVNDAKDEIEGAVTPEEIDEILAEAENEIAAVTEDLKAGQLNTSTLWPWIIVAIVISAALSTLFAWRHVKKVQGKGEAVGAKSVVTIAVATILIFVVVIGITLLIFAMV